MCQAPMLGPWGSRWLGEGWLLLSWSSQAWKSDPLENMAICSSAGHCERGLAPALGGQWRLPEEAASKQRAKEEDSDESAWGLTRTHPRVLLQALCDRVERWTGTPQWAEAVTGVEIRGERRHVEFKTLSTFSMVGILRREKKSCWRADGSLEAAASSATSRSRTRTKT